MDIQPEDQHWLVRPSTIRKFWIGGIAILALTVLAQIFIPIKGYFGADDWFAFGAVYGFGTCALMVVFAKALGFALKRSEGFYDPGEELDGSAKTPESDQKSDQEANS